MLLIHTALHAEARTIISHFNLRRQHQHHAFACFNNNDVWLIESGTGKLNTATAIGWLSALLAAENPVWLNIGMAGCSNTDIGTLVLAHRIEDQINGHRWYPPMLVNKPPDSNNLMSVAQPTSNYPEHAMIDMEASGFFTAASHFTSLELIHSLKVISDNSTHPPTRMKSKTVDALFEPLLPEIEQFTHQLLALRSQLNDPTHEDLQVLLQQHHFSAYQQHTLQRLLQRFQALYPDSTITQDIPTSVDNGKAIIQWLNDQIEQASIHF